MSDTLYPEELQTRDAKEAARIVARISDDVMDYNWNGGKDIDKFVDDVLCRRYFQLDPSVISNAAADTLALIEDWKARASEEEPDTEYGVVRFSYIDGLLRVPVAHGEVLLDRPSETVLGGQYTFDRFTNRIALRLQEFSFV